MSAIWGRISWTENDINTDSMREAYERKCRLDDIREVKTKGSYMACGLQYITKEARYEQLPIYDKKAGCCYTADCLLDNRKELIGKLGVEDNNIPDGSLIYMAYQKWGMKCLEYLRGLFSFAIYDMDKKTLKLATDQFSCRCLYYYVHKGSDIAFSTLIEPIKRLYPDMGYNEDYLKDFAVAPGLMPNIISDETPYENLYLLNPGTWLEITPDNITEHAYYDVAKQSGDYKCHTAKEYGAYFRQLYGKCVDDALRCDGNVGISMSSGLDSASVGALAATALGKRKKELLTYTYIPYEDNVKDSNRNHVLDEQRDVMMIAAMYPNMVTHFMNNGGRNCIDDMDKVVGIMEIPIKAYVNIPNLCEIYENAAKDGCKVVLTGQVGNSTVSHGNIDDVIYDLYNSKRYFSLITYLNNYCKKIKVSRKYGIRKYISYCKEADKIYADKRKDYIPDNPFLSENILNGYDMDGRFEKGGIKILERVPEPENEYRKQFIKKAMYTYLGTLDTKLGLTYNIIIRDPTRDMRMIRFCLNLPFRYFGYKGTPRWLIRGNLGDMLPSSTLDDWMRYCVQNSDWYLRLKRDWDSVADKLVRDFENAKNDSIADIKEAIDFISKMPDMKEEDAKNQFMYLLHIESMNIFKK